MHILLCYAGKENIMQDCSAAHMENSKQTSRTNSFEIENLLKTAEQVTGICRSPGETRKSSPTGSVVSSHSQALTPSRQLSDAEKLKKVILELIETERTYVKVVAVYYILIIIFYNIYNYNRLQEIIFDEYILNLITLLSLSVHRI